MSYYGKTLEEENLHQKQMNLFCTTAACLVPNPVNRTEAWDGVSTFERFLNSLVIDCPALCFLLVVQVPARPDSHHSTVY